MAKHQLKLGTRWLSAADVRAFREQARTNRQAQKRLLASLEQKVGARRADIACSLADIPAPQKTNLINKAISGYRRELRRGSEDTRLAYVKEAGRFREMARAAASHYRSSVQMLARYTLGSERRSRIIQQIAASGPAELSSLAELAAATSDRELGAALCSRLSEIDPAKRPFAAVELADALVGEEFREIGQAIKEMDRLALEAVADDTAFETGKTGDLHRSLEIALMYQDESEDENDEENDAAEEDGATFNEGNQA